MLCCLSLAIGAVGCQTDGKADPTFNPPKSKTVVQTGTRARLRYPTDRLYFYQGTVRLFLQTFSPQKSVPYQVPFIVHTQVLHVGRRHMVGNDVLVHTFYGPSLLPGPMLVHILCILCVHQIFMLYSNRNTIFVSRTLFDHNYSCYLYWGLTKGVKG